VKNGAGRNVYTIFSFFLVFSSFLGIRNEGIKTKMMKNMKNIRVFFIMKRFREQSMIVKNFFFCFLLLYSLFYKQEKKALFLSEEKN